MSEHQPLGLGARVEGLGEGGPSVDALVLPVPRVDVVVDHLVSERAELGVALAVADGVRGAEVGGDDADDADEGDLVVDELLAAEGR